MERTVKQLQIIKFTKTSVKGLLLTIEGKAWHKSAKREIPTNVNGKVRFNGKMFDLQKLIIETSQKKQEHQSVKKGVPIRETQKQGFKKTKIKALYITSKGLCYNSMSKRNLSITKGKITINGKQYNVAKVILETFGKIPIRRGQINFINGNDKDFSFENLEYKSTIKQLPPVASDVIKCIRLYFEVDKNLNKKSLMTKYYLYEIIKLRSFNLKYKGIDFDLFIMYIQTEYFILSKDQITVFDKFNFTVTNGKNAINKYLNLLVCECLQDFENGLLTIKNFKSKLPTKTQKLKELQKSLDESGLDIKIPLRKPTAREVFKDYLKQTRK